MGRMSNAAMLRGLKKIIDEIIMEAVVSDFPELKGREAGENLKQAIHELSSDFIAVRNGARE